MKALKTVYYQCSPRVFCPVEVVVKPITMDKQRKARGRFSHFPYTSVIKYKPLQSQTDYHLPLPILNFLRSAKLLFVIVRDLFVQNVAIVIRWKSD